MHFEFCNCILHLAFCNCILHFAIIGHLFCNKRTIANYKFQACFLIQIAWKSATNFIMIQNLDFIFYDDFSSWRFFHYFLLRIKCKRNQMKFAELNFKLPNLKLILQNAIRQVKSNRCFRLPIITVIQNTRCGFVCGCLVDTRLRALDSPDAGEYFR